MAGGKRQESRLPSPAAAQDDREASGVGAEDASREAAGSAGWKGDRFHPDGRFSEPTLEFQSPASVPVPALGVLCRILDSHFKSQRILYGLGGGLRRNL